MNYVFQCALFILFSDAYLFFQHRLLHTVFAKQHAIHHAKLWLRVHPVELVLNWLHFPVGYLLGFSLWEMLPSMLYGVTVNHLAHQEKDILFPLMTDRIRLHKEHHRDGRVNFGVFFTFWDRVLGTSSRGV